MIITSTETAVKLAGNDWFQIMPKGALIAISDSSDLISFKVQASRKTMFTAPYTDFGSTKAEAIEYLNGIL